MQCPFRFKICFVDNKPMGTKPVVLQKGIEVHELMEEYYKSQSNDLGVLKEKISKHKNFHKYENIMQNFFDFNERISYNSKQVEKPLYIELRMYDKELDMSGVVDVIHHDGKNYLLLDYKTGKSYTIRDKNNREVLDPKYYLELAVYVYLFEKQYKEKITHWGIFFLSLLF
jgi:ATP-dependent exoDNAse (exonuclease V) beta subunit